MKMTARPAVFPAIHLFRIQKGHATTRATAIGIAIAKASKSQLTPRSGTPAILLVG